MSFDEWVALLRRDSLQRRKSAHRTAGSGSSSLLDAWQTPATDSFRCRGGDRKDEQGLDQQARYWRTPDAPTTGGIRTRSKSIGNGHQIVLAEQAAQWPTPCANPAPRGRNFTKSDGHYKPHDLTSAVYNWPTPRSNDHKSGVTGAIAKKNSRPLCEVASQHFLPGLTTRAPGPASSQSIRRLNPQFVEWLMGIPVGWTTPKPLASTAYEHWETASCRLLLRLLSERSEAPLSKAA